MRSQIKIEKSEQYGLILLFFQVLTGKHYSCRTLPDATFHFKVACQRHAGFEAVPSSLWLEIIHGGQYN
ncbi:hypothetical protein D083_1349 [Dickeya solani RNS 08.23.3.1.A]|nr:hypothetical protein A4U42_03320 [Dickeya solani IPO 2222]AUC41698.1 hypothetical protein D083_1349 [Dickeya solani RNS 08.23.3.1.A]AUH10138.1 hypothetical protein BJD21_17715 [Dickeya solani D s0432-1]AUH14086.1 hypothetical protein BJJ98_17685 [Dickeya solani]